MFDLFLRPSLFPGKVKMLLDYVNSHQNVEGIVLTGGSALNVLLNQLVRETLTMPRILNLGSLFALPNIENE